MALSDRYMDKIIEYVEVILANKYAYVANGSVYFDTKAFKYLILLHLDLVGPQCSDCFLV
jgi:cysteinyl-tRNA synthetase